MSTTSQGQDPLYWKLVYPAGRELTEQEVGALHPGQHASVKETPRGAIELHLLRPDGTPQWRLDLRNGYRPVFYRNRYQDVVISPEGAHLSPAHLAATVFGRVRQGGIAGVDEDGTLQVRYDGQLWAFIGGQLVDCPATLVNTPEIQAQVG